MLVFKERGKSLRTKIKNSPPLTPPPPKNYPPHTVISWGCHVLDPRERGKPKGIREDSKEPKGLWGVGGLSQSDENCLSIYPGYRKKNMGVETSCRLKKKTSSHARRFCYLSGLLINTLAAFIKTDRESPTNLPSHPAPPSVSPVFRESSPQPVYNQQ